MPGVALDVARILAKTGDELLSTGIPPDVHRGPAANRAVEVHVFGRRGPARAKSSPMELRGLDHSPASGRPRSARAIGTCGGSRRPALGPRTPRSAPCPGRVAG